jgi:hypothetical protein
MLVAVAACAAERAPVVKDSSGARASADASNPSADSAALIALENDWATGAVKRDRATFERLIAPGFTYSEDDKMMSRDELIQGIVAGSDTLTEAFNEDMVVHHFGSVATVTGWLILRGRGADGPFDRRYRYTDTWAKRDGRWQVIGAHDYLVPARKK